MAGVIMEPIPTGDAHPTPAHGGGGDGQQTSVNRRSPALVETSDISVKKEHHPSAATPSPPSHHSTRSSPSKLLLPVLSEATPDTKSSSSHAVTAAATAGATFAPIQFPPRSAAISSRRGRSRSPTTSTARSPSSMSMHSSSTPTVGLMMHKGDGEAMGGNTNSRIANKDSRDDGATTISSPVMGGGEPVNMSSAAAAAAAAAASFSLTEQHHRHDWPTPTDNQSKRAREYDDDAGGDDGGNARRKFSASSRGRQLHHRSSQHGSEQSNWNIDDSPPGNTNSPNRYGGGGGGGGGNGQWEDASRFSPVPGASAVTSSSSTLLTPDKNDLTSRGGLGGSSGGARGNMVHRVRGSSEGGATSAMVPTPQMLHSLGTLDTPPASFDDRQNNNKGGDGETLSPMDPPQIQHSHNNNKNNQQQTFSPKTFFDEGAEEGGGGDEKNAFSPIDHKPSMTAGSNPTIEMAGSFNLFNHSFDSLGVGMPDLDVGGGLNSFGIVPSTEGGPSMSFPQQPDRSPKTNQRTKSKDESNSGSRNDGQERFNHAPILNGSSSGGSMKMFGGISPSTSFAAAITVGDNAAIADIVLNNSNILSTELSPSGSYHQKDHADRSSHYPRHRSRYNDDPSGRTPPRHPGQSSQIIGPAVDESPHIFPSPPSLPLQGPGGAPSFYIVLRRWRNAFARFTFILPGLKVRESCSVNVSAVGNITVYSGPAGISGRNDHNFVNSGPNSIKGRESQKAAFMPEPSPPVRAKKFPDPNSSEIAIAARRITSAVCAFGGTSQPVSSSRSSSSSSSIFRTKYGGNGDVAFVKTESQMRYEEHLPNRYYENENRLSWEVEERPPIEVEHDEDERGASRKGDRKANRRQGRNGKDGESGRPSSSLGMKSEFPPTSPSPALSASAEQPKLKYRCKLCGLPKQNHTCPYQQSLQRSIGVMVYPAVNAFVSNEPGRLAPPLTDMNNFMGGDDLSSSDNSPPRLKLDDVSTATGSLRLPMQHAGSPHNVTPESMRSSVHNPHSPGSSLSGTPDSTPFRRMGRGRSHYSPQRSMRRGEFSSMNGFGTELAADPLFIETMEIKQEQYRIVSSSKQNTSKGAYAFASLPLPYGQRKRLSDSLFAMSKEIPGLTDECAGVLREARQKGKWDLAVAELMTQVVIIMHCREGDNTLEGLRRYLLTLGIAC